MLLVTRAHLRHLLQHSDGLGRSTVGDNARRREVLDGARRLALAVEIYASRALGFAGSRLDTACLSSLSIHEQAIGKGLRMR